MWIELPEAVKIYARFCEARYGKSAIKSVRDKARELKRKGDLEGHRIWNDVAEEIEQSIVTPNSRRSARGNAETTRSICCDHAGDLAPQNSRP